MLWEIKGDLGETRIRDLTLVFPVDQQREKRKIGGTYLGEVLQSLISVITDISLSYFTWSKKPTGENGYMYAHGSGPSLFTWSYHDTVNRLYPNTK